MPTARQLDAVIAILAACFPKAFALYQERRKPLKIGIHHDITAAIGEVEHLSIAVAYYTRNIGYLRAQKAGVPRIDLDGKEAGVVDAEQAANAQRAIAGIRAKQTAAKANAAPKREQPTPEPTPPARTGLAGLREAGKRRRAAA